MKELWLLLPVMLLPACTSTTERGGASWSLNGVTTGQGSRLEIGPDVTIGPDAQESSPSVRQRNTGKPPVNQPFANDPATSQPSK